MLRTLGLPMALFPAAYYFANCMYQSYMSLYYTDKGFDSARIGMINGAVAVVSLIAQPIWGMAADRAGSKRRMIALLAMASGALAAALAVPSGYAAILALACGFAFFYTAIQPLGDSVMLQRLEARKQPFGPIRLWGCAAFAVGGPVFGLLLDFTGPKPVPVYTAILLGLTALSALALPHCPGKRPDGRRMAFSALFRNKPLLGLLCFMAPVQITMGYFYTFFSPYFTALPGANESLLGWGYLISAVSEVPFLLAADRLFDRFGAGRLMCAAAAVLCARWAILGLFPNVPAAMLSQALHGGGFIVMTVCMAKYISRAVPDELRSSGQMLLAVVSFGISRLTGNLAGGFLAQAFGRRNVFLMASGLCLAALCAFAPGYFRRPPLNGLDGG